MKANESVADLIPLCDKLFRAKVPKLEFAEEDIRPVIEAIAATGAFWYMPFFF